MDTVMIISGVIVGAVLWVLYHKIFHVIYFNAMRGLFKEIVVCFILGVIISAAFVYIGINYLPLIIAIAVIAAIIVIIDHIVNSVDKGVRRISYPLKSGEQYFFKIRLSDRLFNKAKGLHIK